MDLLIAVVIPTYNHAHFIGRAIQSVLDQTYTNWEILVVDNHSTDNTEEVIKSLNDGRIQLLKIHNSGVIGMSRNMGILKAKGDWIFLIDADDYFISDIGIILKKIKNKSLDIKSFYTFGYSKSENNKKKVNRIAL